MEEPYSKKLSHEAFISGHDGSSPVDIILSVMPVVPGSILAAAFTSSHSTIWNFTKEYVFCILPLILSFTVLKDASLELCALMFFLLLLRISQIQRPFGTSKNEFDVKDNKLASLTSSRATVNIATIIAILAVDFHIFPRRFAKTEKYGYSLMDVGAACYLFMNGITDSRKKSLLKRDYVKNILILGALGLVRLMSLKSTNYQQHISEYGVHCNFFFTLSAVKILNMLGFHKLTKIRRIFSVISLAVIHQMVLLGGLEEWVMSNESRTDFLLQNKEWFVSLPGNFLAYLIGHLVGDFLLDYNNQRSKNNIRRTSLLPVYPFVILFVFTIFFDVKPSRRVANIPFLLWIAGFFLFFLTIFEVLGNLFGERSCLIFKSVNNYSLLFFLLGNLFTGFINILLNTLEVSNFMAFVVLNVYCYSLCYIVYILHRNKINNK